MSKATTQRWQAQAERTRGRGREHRHQHAHHHHHVQEYLRAHGHRVPVRCQTLSAPCVAVAVLNPVYALPGDGCSRPLESFGPCNIWVPAVAHDFSIRTTFGVEYTTGVPRIIGNGRRLRV